MFDANMRCLPKGKYFAEVWSCDKGDLYDIGIRHKMVVMFEKFNDNDKTPTVTVHHDGKQAAVKYKCRMKEHYLVYAGNYDLSDFINDKSLDQAKRIVEAHKKWLS